MAEVTARTNRWRLVLIGVAGFAWALASLWMGDQYRHRPFGEQAAIAAHLAAGHGFASPVDPSPGAEPSTWSPPLYPFVIAACYRTLGVNTHACVVALAVLNAAFFGLLVAAMHQLLASIAGARAGWMGAGLVAVHPTILHFAGDYWDGCLAMSLFVTCLALAASWSARRITLGHAAGLGALLGVLSLANATCALAYPVIVLAAARRSTTRGRVAASVVAFAAFAAVLAPWTIRNHAVTGKLLYVRNGMQLSLWLGNVPGASGWWNRSALALSPDQHPDENRSLRELGETGYFELCLERFVRDYRAEPGAFWARTARRAAHLVLGEPREPSAIRPYSRRPVGGLYLDRLVVDGAIALLGIAGGWVAWRRYRAGWLPLAGALAAVPPLVTFASERFALPLRAVLVACAALLIASAFRPESRDGGR